MSSVLICEVESLNQWFGGVGVLHLGSDLGDAAEWAAELDLPLYGGGDEHFAEHFVAEVFEEAA
jgi:hypothetical protein